MSQDKEAPKKTRFELLLEWANRDKVCAMALTIGIIGVFPHAANFILEALKLILSSTAVAAVLGAK